MNDYKKSVAEYFDALDSGDLASMTRLFSADAMVHSPMLGRVSAVKFFPKGFAASIASNISVFDILVSTIGEARAVGYFNYEWTLQDGSVINFDCADVFNFDNEGRIREMIILYDTHPTRATVADKYK